MEGYGSVSLRGLSPTLVSHQGYEVSHFGISLSLRESLGQLVHKGFEQSLNSKGLYFIVFFAKRRHLFIGRGERGKVTLENQGTGGERSSGDVEAPPRAQQASQLKHLLGNLRDDRHQSPRRQQSAVNGRPSESRLSTDGIPKSRRLSDFSYRLLSVLAVDRLRPSVDR